MRIKHKLLFKLAACLPLIGSVAPSFAVESVILAQAAIGKSGAAEAARSAYGGKVLSVEELKKDGKTRYRVKLLLDGGRIKYVTVDGSSGKVV